MMLYINIIERLPETTKQLGHCDIGLSPAPVGCGVDKCRISMIIAHDITRPQIAMNQGVLLSEFYLNQIDDTDTALLEISKEDFMPRRLTIRRGKQQRVLDIRISELHLKPKFKKDTFSYTPPLGVTPVNLNRYEGVESVFD